MNYSKDFRIGEKQVEIWVDDKNHQSNFVSIFDHTKREIFARIVVRTING